MLIHCFLRLRCLKRFNQYSYTVVGDFHNSSKELIFMVELKDKIALVTGAGRGIGKEIALELARKGATVVVTDVTDEIVGVVKQIETFGGKALPLKCDVTNPKETQTVVDKAIEKYGRIDILVNNAGIYPQKSFLDLTVEDWNRVININLNGNFNCTKAVVPKMVAQKYGKIINIASIAGSFVAYLNLTHYSASKAGIVGFTKSLALEMAQYGINVNAIAPGPIDVGIIPAGSEFVKQILQTIPLGRMGLPKDVANVVVFLASDESNFITGQCIVCDGGSVLP
jgi:3-oxoacyl-[acyl-carrier protein] reductase